MSRLEIDYLEAWREALLEWAVPNSEPVKPLEQEGDAWASLAQRFRAMNRAFKPETDPFFGLLSRWLSKDVAVIEIGPGAGRYTLPVAERVRKVVAVESSPGMRAALAEEAASLGLANVEVVAGAWPAATTEPADLVFCANVLYDVAEVGPFLRQMNAVARRACFIYLTVTHPFTAFRDLWENFRQWSPPDHPTYLDAAECLYQIGIAPSVQIVNLQPSMVFTSVDEAVDFVRFRLQLPDDPAVKGALREYLTARGQDRDGRFLPHFQFRQSAILWWEKLD